MKRVEHYLQVLLLACVYLVVPLSLHAKISTNWFYFDNKGHVSGWGEKGCAYGLSFTNNQDGDNTVTVSAYTEGSDATAKTAVNVVIPEKVVENGTTYTVTRVDNVANGSNTEDEGVFSSRTIPDYFRQIVSAVIPNTVTKIGNGTFWSCVNMKSIILGNHVNFIGNDAFQYCESLESISLPNTLTEVGDHFLCHCNKLTSLVVPEALTKIGSYFLHGCQSMRDVYLLGTDKKELGEYPFCSQDEHGDQQVHDCTFWVESEQVYKDNYQNGDNWKYADINNNDVYDSRCDGTYQNGGNGLGKNQYKWEPTPPTFIEYKAKWITACFPTDVDVKANFGDNAKIAEMTKANYIGVQNGEHTYHLTFTIVEPNEGGDLIMKAGQPYLLSVDPENEGSGYIIKQADKEITPICKEVGIENDKEDPSANHTSIKMTGTFTDRSMAKGEFFFSNPDPKEGEEYNQDMGFYQINAVACTLPAYKCYWQIVKDNVPCQKAKLAIDLEENEEGLSTSIKIVHSSQRSHSIYNLQGQKCTQPLNQLSKGIYLIDGKKYSINK